MLKFFSAGFAILSLLSCSKTNVAEEPKQPDVNANFTTYTINAGKQFCNNNPYVTTSYSELKFLAKFDSTSIYSTKDPGRQDDINKLYGFSDNNAMHHQFSARFGWRWSNNALRLFGYTYNNGVNEFKELGTVVLGREITCGIKVTSTAYVFLLNNTIDSLPRKSTTVKAEGYKLYPYFGGFESAPHDVKILVREM